MKKLIEDDTSAIEFYRGKRTTFFHLNYIYTGVVVAIDGDRCELAEPAIVYDTGRFEDKEWADAQALPHPIWINFTTCEMFGEVK